MSLTEQGSPFSQAATVPERVAHLRRAVADKSIHSLTKNPAFSQVIDKLAGDALADPAYRPVVLAVLGRIHATNKVKAFEHKLREAIRRLLADPLPAEASEDGDDRYYVAVCCRLADAIWMPGYLARATVREESHENARREAVLGLVEKVGHLEAAIALLAQAMRDWSPETEAPSDSAVRRARRVLGALADMLATYESNAECEPGRPLGALLLASVKGGVAPSAKVVGEIALQVLAVVHGLVRSRFSLAAVPSTYDAVRVLRDWFPRGGWARWSTDEDNRVATASLQRDVVQALTLLVKQGTCDDALFDQLVLVSGSRDRAREQARSIASTVRGLAPDVQAWLTTGERPHAQPVVEPTGSLALESRMLQEDVSIARLLRDLGRFTSTGELLRERLLPELEVVAPPYVRTVEVLLQQVQMIDQDVKLLADRRGLRLRGRPGDVEEYTPLEHQPVDVTQVAGARWVRLVEPVVERVSEEGIAAVVEKALVERAPSPTEPPAG